MIKPRKKIINKILSFVLAVAMTVTLTPAALMSQTDEVCAATSVSAPRVKSESTTWDCVYFGHYPQSKNSGGGYNNDPIKWRVLSVNGDDAFLLADKNIDSGIPYNEVYMNITWENCTMRSWLNSTFMNKAFSKAEQSAINETTIKNAVNPEYGTEGGNDTTDKVFLLSIGEVTNPSYGFPSSYNNHDSRDAVNTAYIASKAGMNSEGSAEWWRLRSPGDNTDTVAYVGCGGGVYAYGDYVNKPSGGVRPALHLNLKSSIWSYAGTVSSDGNSEVPETSDNYIKGDITVTYNPSIEAVKESTITGYYSDDFFTESNSSYNKELAQFSLLVTMASMSKYTTDKAKRNEYINNLLSDKLKFNNLISHKYNVSLDNSDDTVGYTFACKKINGSNVMVIAIRSGGYGSEWASNARVGATSFTEHTGFSKAASAVLKDAKTYAAEKNIDKIWITGYSRGGAVSNILGKKIVDNGLITSSNLYCYTFEAPMTKQSAGNVRGLYNTVSLSDPVPQVPLATWGFNRYGTNLYLKSSKLDKSYKSNLSAVKKTYKSIAGEEYTGSSLLRTEAFLELLNGVVGGCRASYAEKWQSSLATILNSSKGGEKNFRETKTKRTNTVKQLICELNAEKTAKKIGLKDEILGAMMVQHYPEATYSWLKNTTPVKTNAFKKTSFMCTVKDFVFGALSSDENDTEEGNEGSSAGKQYTIQVFDDENTLVAEIINGDCETFMEENPDICVDAYYDGSGKTTILIPEDSNYSFEIKADEDIKMNYSMSEYEGEGELTRVIDYEDIDISEGETMLANSEQGTDIDYDSYNPTVNGKEIDPDRVVSGENLFAAEITTEAIGDGIITGGGMYPDGTNVKISATAEHNAEFAGWYENGKKISDEESIIVEAHASEIRNIVGKFKTQISDCDISDIGARVYTGKLIEPVPEITCRTSLLENDDDFVLSYSTNRSVGGGKVYISGKGVFTGNITKTFKINPKGTYIKRLKRARKAFTVKWNRQSAKMSKSRITGYQIRYSRYSSMSNAKIKTVKGYSNTSKKIRYLKAKKRYYVQVRTYKTVNGTRYYSSWSKKKYVKTR